MKKNIKVDEDLWKEINQEKLDKGYKEAQDVIKNWRDKNAKKKR